MTQDISAIVEEVKQKQGRDEKAFLHFLQTLDINTLHQLYFIFNRGSSLRNPMQMLQLLIIPLSVFSGLIIVFMNSNTQGSTSTPSNLEFFEAIIGFGIALVGIFNYIKMRRLAKEPELIKLSHKIVTKQKTLSMIAFVLEKKYETLSDPS